MKHQQHPYLKQARSYFAIARKREIAGDYVGAAHYRMVADRKLSAYHRTKQRDKGWSKTK